MTPDAFQLAVDPFEWIIRKVNVIERVDLKRRRDVTHLALSLGRSEAKLPGMNVAVAAGAFPWSALVRRASATRPVTLRGSMTAFTGRLRMGAGQRPGAVIDPGRVPPRRGMAVGTPAIGHFGCELIAVRVPVAVYA
jgi:hypothetical protein